jgi:hypothetical protein
LHGGPARDPWYTDSRLRERILRITGLEQAVFVPGEDLFQRRGESDLRDHGVTVPLAAAQAVDAAVAAIASIPDTAYSADQWKVAARGLIGLTETIWFVDRPELRGPQFRLYGQIGRCLALAGSPASDDLFADWGAPNLAETWWVRAAIFAKQEPSLLETVDRRTQAGITAMLDRAEAGALPMFHLDFRFAYRLETGDADNPSWVDTRSADAWDSAAFSSQYVVYLDGREIHLDGPVLTVPRTRLDLMLLHEGGYGPSVTLFEEYDTYWNVRNAATLKLEAPLVRDLMADLDAEPAPAVDTFGEMDELATYAALNAPAALYVALPIRGHVRNTAVWRFDQDIGRLRRIVTDRVR